MNLDFLKDQNFNLTISLSSNSTGIFQVCATMIVMAMYAQVYNRSKSHQVYIALVRFVTTPQSQIHKNIGDRWEQILELLFV